MTCHKLEYDTDRAGTFEPLRFLPKHKTVVLGLISSKLPQVSVLYYFHDMKYLRQYSLKILKKYGNAFSKQLVLLLKESQSGRTRKP